MEISVGEYGRMIFEMAVGNEEEYVPDHWKSILAEAEPLVRQLLALNDKMVFNNNKDSYKIVGYTEVVDGKGKKKKKKKVLSAHQRIDLAREKLWEVKAKTLKEGDQVWLHKDYDLPMEDLYESPVEVEIVKGNRIIVTHPHGSRAGIYEISADELVLKAPADWDDNEEYRTDAYWLAKADELDI